MLAPMRRSEARRRDWVKSTTVRYSREGAKRRKAVAFNFVWFDWAHRRRSRRVHLWACMKLAIELGLVGSTSRFQHPSLCQRHIDFIPHHPSFMVPTLASISPSPQPPQPARADLHQSPWRSHHRQMRSCLREPRRARGLVAGQLCSSDRRQRRTCHPVCCISFCNPSRNHLVCLRWRGRTPGAEPAPWIKDSLPASMALSEDPSPLRGMFTVCLVLMWCSLCVCRCLVCPMDKRGTRVFEQSLL